MTPARPNSPVLLQRYWPLVVAIACLALAIVYVLRAFSGRTGAQGIVYCLDDAYIHLAMAKNLIAHGVYGIDPRGFAGASSSLLWVGLLAIPSAVFGPAAILPFLLNVLSGIGLLASIAVILRRYAAPPALVLLVLLLVVFDTPLLPVLFGGMEHVLHALLTLAFLAVSAAALAAPERRQPARALVALAPALTAVRYESLFLLAIACAALLLRGRRRVAVAVGLAGAAPLAVFAIVSMAHGAFVLPSSVLAKASAISLDSWSDLAALLRAGPGRLLSHRVLGRLVIVTLAVSGLTYWRTRRVQQAYLAGAFLGMSLLHATFALFGWFYRYEAYLIIAGFVVAAVVLAEAIGWSARPAGRRARVARWAAALALAAYLGDGLAARARRGLVSTPRAMRNIYEQQYQMGRFVREFYAGESIAANDIGAISYLGDARLLDLAGLADAEVLRLLRAGRLDAPAVARLASDHQVKIAMLYARDFVPPQWHEVAAWTIRDNLVCAGETVTFYATNAAEAARLQAHLAAFAAALPPSVEQRLAGRR